MNGKTPEKKPLPIDPAPVEKVIPIPDQIEALRKVLDCWEDELIDLRIRLSHIELLLGID